jgi:hypothetical protein
MWRWALLVAASCGPLLGACFQQLDEGAASGGATQTATVMRRGDCAPDEIVGAGGTCLPFDDSTPPIDLDDGGTTDAPCVRTVARALAIRRAFCASCHAPPAKMGGFDSVLDDRKLVTAVSAAATDDAGAPARLIIPGDPEHSRLYRRVAEMGMPDQMPPIAPPTLPPNPSPSIAELSILRSWIQCLGDGGAYGASSSGAVLDGGADR